MRKVIYLLLTLSLLLAACGVAPTVTPPLVKATLPPAKPSPTPVPQVFSWAAESQMVTVVPCCNVFDKNTQAMLLLVFEGLVVMNPETSRMEPQLAESWETSADGLTWTFHLRKGVTFSDDSPLDAATVKYWIEKSLDPSSRVAPRLTSLKAIEVADALTLKVITTKPNSLVIYGMGGMIQGRNSTPEKPVGTGQYVYKEITPEKVTVVKRQGYWGKAPKLDQITYYWRADATSRLAGLQTGEVDLIQNLTVENSESLGKDPRFVVVHPDSTLMMALRFNTRRPQYQDARVRLALNYAIDRKPILDKILLGAGYLPEALGGHGVYGTPTLKGELYPFDLAKAQQMMRDAGWAKDSSGKWAKGGEQLKMILSASEGRYLKGTDLAQYVAQQLVNFGVAVDLQIKPWADWSPNVMKWAAEGLIDAALSGQGGTYAMGNWASDLRSSASKTNYTGFNDPNYDKIVAFFEATMDEAAQLKILEQAHAYLVPLAPYLQLVGQRPFWAASAHVKGLKFSKNEIPLFHEVTMQ